MKRKIFILGCFLICLLSCQAEKNSFFPGALWPDDQGRHINAHGGGLLYDQGCYYWFGEYKSDYTNDAKDGVSCYTSSDLYHWKNAGIALSVVFDNPNHPLAAGCIIERPKVIYNAKTHQYVMYFHHEWKGRGYSSAKVGVAVSDKVTGPYTFIKSIRPNAGCLPENMLLADTAIQVSLLDTLTSWTPLWMDYVQRGIFMLRDLKGGQMSRDMTLYVDDDGKAYHIYASEENLTLQIAELSDDYQSHTGKYIRVAPAGHNEAPSIFKKDGQYFMITSGCTGWKPNAARLLKAASIWGPWEYCGNPWQGDQADISFDSQSTFILPVSGKKDAYIFMADRWRPRRPSDGRYIWLPIIFENGLPVLKWQDQWSLDVFEDR